MTNEECVRLLYRHILGREPDPAGLQGWTALIDNSGDIKTVLDGLINSPEFAARNSASTSHNLPQTTLSACREQLGRKLILVDVGAQELTFAVQRSPRAARRGHVSQSS